MDAAFQKLRTYWDGLLGICQVTTPDIHTDRMVNVWNAYQCMATFNMSRSASFYESGIGRGLGFRDSNQDLLGFVHMVPERARELIGYSIHRPFMGYVVGVHPRRLLRAQAPARR